jgi:hypothetical protein
VLQKNGFQIICNRSVLESTRMVLEGLERIYMVLELLCTIWRLHTVLDLYCFGEYLQDYLHGFRIVVHLESTCKSRQSSWLFLRSSE